MARRVTAEEARRRKACDSCRHRAWCAISLASGLRRCWACWVAAYHDRH
jgi:hypothetical protein